MNSATNTAPKCTATKTVSAAWCMPLTRRVGVAGPTMCRRVTAYAPPARSYYDRWNLTPPAARSV